MPASAEPREARRPLALFGNGLGDHLMTLPAVRALAAGFEGRLGLVCRPGAWRRFFADLPLRTVCQMPFCAGACSCFTAAQSLVPDRDLLVWLNPWRGRVLDALVAAEGVTVGRFRRCTRFVETDAAHAVDEAFAIARAVFPHLCLEDFAAPPYLAPAAVRAAQRVRAAVGVGRRLLAVHADPSTPDRRWPDGRLAECLAHFLKAHPEMWVLLVGGAAANRQPACDHERVVSLCGLSFATTMAVVAEADLFLGVDSCFLHAADLFRVPGVGLFGPTDPAEFGFRFTPVHAHLRAGTSMRSITTRRVVEALESVGQRSRSAPPRPQPTVLEPGGHRLIKEHAGVCRTWQVEALWWAAAGRVAEDIEVTAVDLERPFWFGDGERPTMRAILEHFRRAMTVDLDDPLVLGPSGELMDGMHRVMRAAVEGRERLPAVRLETLPEPLLTEVEVPAGERPAGCPFREASRGSARTES